MYRFNFAVSFLLLIGAHSVFVSESTGITVQGLAGQAALEPRDEIQRLIRKQKTIVRKELDLMKAEMDLHEEAVETISSRLSDEIKSAFPTDEEIDAGAKIDFERRSQRELEQQVYKAARENLTEDKQPSLEVYIANVTKFNEKVDKASQETVVHMLDSFLSLSQVQEEKLLEILTSNWPPGLNKEASMSLIEGIASSGMIMSLLEENEVKNLLSRAQLVVFENDDQQQVSRNNWNGEELDLARVRVACTSAMELRIAEIEELCGLDEKQLRYLAVGRKGAVEQVLRHWEKTYERFSEVDELYDSLVGIKLVSDPLLSQCEAQSKWKKVLKKTLNAEQFDKLQKNMEAHKLRRRRVVLNYGTISILAELKLSYAQLCNFEKVIKDRVFVDGRIGYLDPIVDFMLLEDEVLRPLFSDPQWEEIGAEFAATRESIREMQENQDAVIDNAAEPDDLPESNQ